MEDTKKENVFYELRTDLIKVGVMIAWLMISGEVLIGLFDQFNPLLWKIIILSAIINTFITFYPWKILLKKNEDYLAFFIVTVLFISIASIMNYLQHTNRLFPYVLIIIFSSIFYDKNKYIILSLMTTLGATASMLSMNKIDVLMVETMGILIFAYVCYYLSSAYKNEAILRFNKSNELQKKVEQLKKIDSERNRLIKQLMRVQEDERKRISRELHDEIGQTLNSLLITLEISYKKATEGKLKDDLEVSINEFQGAISEIDRIIWSLRPIVLDDLGLEPAIRTLVKRYVDRIGLDIKFNSKVNEKLSSDIETVLYRFTQESLNNIIKHAKASKVLITLENKNSSVKMAVNDNGTGFLKKVGQDYHGGIGLKGMKERLSIFGGSLNIITSDKGTVLEALIPM